MWWGKYDPDYSRNRIMWHAFDKLGWTIRTFRPRNTEWGYVEARLRRISPTDLLFVPCFCQKDIDAALRYGHYYNIPVLIDPLISLYDSRVFERKTINPDSRKARRLLKWEFSAFSRADGVIADTEAHGRYYSEMLGVDREKIHIIPVGAEESLFYPAKTVKGINQPVQVLFYGSFLPLQGVEVITDAILCYQGPSIAWCLLGGTGTQRQAKCAQVLSGLDNVTFEQNIPYEKLARRIHQADILLGVFGSSDKTRRVIPNKVYQSIACGKPVITCDAPYPDDLVNGKDSGIFRVPPGNAAKLADTIAQLASEPNALTITGENARKTYIKYFRNEIIITALASALNNTLRGI